MVYFFIKLCIILQEITNLLSIYSLWHRILINLRSQRVVHITSQVKSKNLFKTPNRVDFFQNIFDDGDELVSSMKNANDVLNSSSKVGRKTVLPQTVDRTTIVSKLKTNDDIWREEIQRMKGIVSR